MNKKLFFIIGILAIGSVSSILAANTIVDNTSVSTTTVNTVNAVASNSINTKDLTVTGTCTGCGGSGALEGTFTNWNTVIYNMTTSVFNFGAYELDNSGNVQGANGLIFANGTITQIYGGSAGSSIASQSLTGKYQLYDNATIGSGVNRTDTIYILSNGTVVNSIIVNWETFPYPIDNVQCGGAGTFVISPNGKYIEEYGFGITNGGSCNTSNHRYILFRGS